MREKIMQNYAKITKFLGDTLGPNYEVVLHDLTDKNHSVIAIANNQVSGRNIGAPLPNIALKILKDKRWEKEDYVIHYHGRSIMGKKLRSSTFFIKNEKQIFGMLCINFDDSKYVEINEMIMQLCHPDSFLETNFLLDKAKIESLPNGISDEANLYDSMSNIIDSTVTRILKSMGIESRKLEISERIEVVRHLEKEGIFLLKGAVKDVAKLLHCSPATVYRYIAQVREEMEK